ncbi:MAG: hypothetical protein PHD13_00570 [Methanocellales archaeon]|nr:hypothetical protein [Methanocellales archaeon]MDD3291450.1 hypothetical protein [Methanocellales archaeon]MDD5234660.1 hypothetical protein [Methanocellales archaeon]MDD5484987.1 hypothetical protein [Methanocellales archaeon]
MKRIIKAGIASALLLIVMVVYFFLAIYTPGGGLYIRAEKVTNIPEYYVEVDKAELERYPYIAQAVLNPGKEIRVPFDDESTFEFLKVFPNAHRTRYIKFEGDYYRLSAISAD